MELWTPTCCLAKQLLWTLRSRWSPAWRRGPSTTGYLCLSVTAKRPVKTSSGKRSPRVNRAQKPPGSVPPFFFFFSPAPQLNMNCSRSQLYISSTPVQHRWTSLRQCVCLNTDYLCTQCTYLCIVPYRFISGLIKSMAYNVGNNSGSWFCKKKKKN